MMTVEEAVAGRRGVRAFLPKPVPRRLIERAGDRRPRAVRSQRAAVAVWVLPGAAREETCASASRATTATGEQAGVHYYPVKWREPYLARRRVQLGSLRHWHRPRGQADYTPRAISFFDAPVGSLLDRP
jgi:hypothetical protein